MLYGLKWFVRLNPLTDRRNEYLSFTLKSFETRESSEKKCGNLVRFGSPTYSCSAFVTAYGKPLRHSNSGEMRILLGSFTMPHARKRFGRSPDRFDDRFVRTTGKGKLPR